MRYTDTGLRVNLPEGLLDVENPIQKKNQANLPVYSSISFHQTQIKVCISDSSAFVTDPSSDPFDQYKTFILHVSQYSPIHWYIQSNDVTDLVDYRLMLRLALPITMTSLSALVGTIIVFMYRHGFMHVIVLSFG